MALNQQQMHQRRTQAVREASNSSVDEDRKISGSWLNGTAPSSASASALSSSSSKTQSNTPGLSIDTGRARSISKDNSAPKKRGHVQKQEKIERIGLLRGSSYVREKDANGDQQMTTSIGLQDDAVYNAYQARPVAYLRSIIVSLLRKEAPLHAKHQEAVRRPWLDRYFVNTSLLGTHSFFLIFLPMMFWLGSPRFARGLINVLAFGVYFSSAIKDLFCVPRPYSPPVTRLTIGTHHLEYGFPSTHSTNSVSIALYIYLWVRRIRLSHDQEAAAALLAYAPSSTASSIFDSWFWEAGLLFYALSVVYGRIYAGMHSITDCIAGSALGAAITWLQWRFFDHIEDFIKINSWTVPIAIIPTGLLMVSVHPQPVDDCPCFEDAIAFVSVAMGVALARWSGIRFGIILNSDPFNHEFSQTLTAGSANATSAKLVDPLFEAVRTPLAQLVNVGPAERTVKNILVLVIGVVNVLLVRVIIKTACKVVLPPTFRLVDKLIGFSLPRRHYTQAKDYNNIPLADLSAVPSVIDLPSQIIVTDESGNQQTIQSPVSSPYHSRRSSSTDAAGPGSRSPAGLHAFSPTTSAFSRSSLVASPSTSPVPSRTPSPNPVEMRRNAQKLMTKSPTKKIKFTLGGPVEEEDDQQHQQHSSNSPSDLPIPLTQSKAHPDFVPPDEKVARQLAGEIKGTNAKEVEREVKHYDADVLTKVIVYTNIGLFSAGLIPALFEKLGLT